MLQLSTLHSEDRGAAHAAGVRTYWLTPLQAQFWMLKYVTSKAFKAIRAIVAIVAFILSMLACLYAVL